MIASEDVAAALAACQARDASEHGIETFVALEDARTGPMAEPGEEFAALLAACLAGLHGTAGLPYLDDESAALQVLARMRFEVDAPGHLRLINYHNTPAAMADEYRRQLAAAGDRWAAVSQDDLDRLLGGEPWAGPRAGILPVLFEGYRNNYDVALPLVEAAGLRALFVVPSAFLDVPPAEQAAFAFRYDIVLLEGDRERDRIAMTWEELRDAADRGHLVACHTAHHRGVDDLVTDADLRRELHESKARMEDKLEREVPGIAFLWGTPAGVEPRVDEAIADAGYRYVLANTRLQRVGG